MIAIINYGSGNIAAIANIYKQLRIPCLICDQASDLAQAERYILPGVGAFDATMQHLASSGMLDVLVEEVVGHGKKVLGICVGMQILAESSEEGSLPGLGWIAGRVKKIDASRLVAGPRLPHMGWNSIRLQVDSGCRSTARSFAESTSSAASISCTAITLLPVSRPACWRRSAMATSFPVPSGEAMSMASSSTRRRAIRTEWPSSGTSQRYEHASFAHRSLSPPA